MSRPRAVAHHRAAPRQGQTTIELALLLPILALFVFLTWKGFDVVHRSSQRIDRKHEANLADFDHGNGTLRLDALDIDLGDQSIVLPEGLDTIGSDAIGAAVVGQLTQLGLDQLLSKIPFLSDRTYLSGFARGFLSSALGDLITNDFKFDSIQWDSAVWQGVAGALSSKQAGEDFRNLPIGDKKLAEFLGSGLQSGLVAFTRSEGDWKAGAQGAFTGLMGSEAAQDYFEKGSEIFKGALKGAIQASADGVFSGNLNAKDIAIGTIVGGVSTNQFAEFIPLTKWNGDAKDSFVFRTLTTTAASALSGQNAGDAILAGVTSGAVSRQVMQGWAGGNALAGGAIGAGVGALGTLANGGSAEDVALGAFATAQSAVFAQAKYQLMDRFKSEFSDIQSKSAALAELQRLEASASFVAATAKDLFQDGVDPLQAAMMILPAITLMSKTKSPPKDDDTETGWLLPKNPSTQLALAHQSKGVR